MAPNAVDEWNRPDQTDRFRRHGALLWILWDQRLLPWQRFVSESCADLTWRRQADHEVTPCGWTVQRVGNVGAARRRENAAGNHVLSTDGSPFRSDRRGDQRVVWVRPENGTGGASTAPVGGAHGPESG
jgi:hypothetical protein